MWWIGYLVTCWLIADFISGVFHWWEDQYANETWPLVGKWIAKPNQQHHRKPFEFTKGSYLYRNSTAIVPALIAAAVAWLIHPLCALPFVMVSQSNEIHCWSHRACNPVIRTLQATGLLQDPTHHLRHHRDPFNRRFCVMSNWLNPVLDGVHFWTAIEWTVRKLSGIESRSFAGGAFLDR